jgi:Zn-dependent protease with chaperone function
VNFFEYQQKARSRTKLLVFLFILAVLGVGTGIYFAIMLVSNPQAFQSEYAEEVGWWDPELFAIVVGSTLAFIGLASLFRIATLAQGGGAVARMLGGRQVEPNTSDLKEKTLYNVVEEMAIAAGLPVPEVYVLDGESGINAFAAGFTPDRAAVAVTRGTLETLTRDELQGVIAHEFSHILNGDMRLNIRLMGVLFGIMAITVIGRILLRTARLGFSRGRGKGGGNPLPIIGLAMIVIGYIGVLIGRIIQAAVSRQREYLADSSAVQFTRNPLGIGMALRKIQVYVYGSYLSSAHAEEVGHFLFGPGLPYFFQSIFATHPPLEERIRRINPKLLGEEVALKPPSSPQLPQQQTRPLGALSGNQVVLNPAGLINRVGVLDAQTLALSSAIMASLPAELAAAAHSQQGARELLFALLMGGESGTGEAQLLALKNSPQPVDTQRVLSLAGLLEKADPAVRLPLLEKAVAALRNQSPQHKRQLLTTVQELIAADNQVDLFEFVAGCLLEHRFGLWVDAGAVYHDLGKLDWHLAHLLALLCQAGNPQNAEAAQAAFRGAIERLKSPRAALLVEAFRGGRLGNFGQVKEALKRLSRATEGVKQAILESINFCVMADGRVSVEEAELVRLIYSIMGAPLPPFISERST